LDERDGKTPWRGREQPVQCRESLTAPGWRQPRLLPTLHLQTGDRVISTDRIEDTVNGDEASMSRDQHPSSRARHESHEDERIRVLTLERQERHAAQRMLVRALRALIQPHEPHHYRAPGSVEWSPPPMDSPVAPGGVDNTGFLEGGIC
jgi:hypothetical protein